MVVGYGYTQLGTDDDAPSLTKENTSTFAPTAPPLYTSLGFNNAQSGATPQPLYPHLNAVPGAPQPLYPHLPQVFQPLNGQWFNPFSPHTTNPTAVTEPAAPTEVVGNVAAEGSTAPQIINYQITYYAPVNSENSHTEFINCCEDCCEDCCENWCLNCCLDCSKITNALLGANGANAATIAEATNSATPTASSTGLVWDNGFTSIPLGAENGSTPTTNANGSTPFTLGNGFASMVKNLVKK